MDEKEIWGPVCQSVLTNQNLTYADKVVYSLLTTFARQKDFCYPSIRSICKALGASTATVTKSLEALEKEGVITSEKLSGRGSIYHLEVRPGVSKTETVSVSKTKTPKEDTVSKIETGVSKTKTPPFQKLKRTVSKIETEYKKEDKQLNSRIEYQEEKEKKESPPELELSPTFSDFWNLYDKKDGHKKCQAKWKKIKQADKEKIMEHLPAYIQATPDKKFRKNPLTYLNGEHWNDEIIPQNGNNHKTVQEGFLETVSEEWMADSYRMFQESQNQY